MKTLIISFFALPLVAASAPIHYSGLFAEPTESFYMTDDKAGCEKDGGTFEGEDGEGGTCFVTVENTVEVKETEKGYFINVSTYGSNLHMCGFDGDAQLVDGKIVATQKSEFTPGEDCTVTVAYIDENTVSVSARGEACHKDYCGARAWGLGIENAKRK